MRDNYEHLKETVELDVFKKWQEVDLVIYAFTDLGMNVAINDEYMGLIYRNQIFDNYKEGQKLKGYIKLVREDGKIDVSLRPNRGKYIFSTSDKILEHLKESGGKSVFNDKSSPEDIKREFQVSKRMFKEAIGKLYKLRKIIITNNGIELVE